MKLAEVEKMATRGPWYIRDLEHVIGKTTCEICYGKDDECITDGVYVKADGVLLLHWKEHGPKLLEALINAQAFFLETQGANEYGEVITAAEEVEGI